MKDTLCILFCIPFRLWIWKFGQFCLIQKVPDSTSLFLITTILFVLLILILLIFIWARWALFMLTGIQTIHGKEGLEEHIVTTRLFLKQCLLFIEFSLKLLLAVLTFIFITFCSFLRHTFIFLHMSLIYLCHCDATRSFLHSHSHLSLRIFILLLDNFIEGRLESRGKVQTRLKCLANGFETRFSYDLKYVLPACDRVSLFVSFYRLST